MGKLGKHSGNIVNEQWKHCETLKLEGSGLKGSGPLLFFFITWGYELGVGGMQISSELAPG